MHFVRLALALFILGLSCFAFAGPVCPKGVYFLGGTAPVLTVRTSSGMQIIVCADSRKPDKTGAFRMSEFDTYFVNPSGKISAPLKSGGANEEFIVKPQKDRLVLQQVVYFMGEHQPLFDQAIECDSKECRLSKEDCVMRPVKAKSEKALAAFKKSVAPSETDVSGLFDLAVTGNIEARALMKKDPGALKLDGATAEVFTANVKILQRLVDAGCVK